MRKAKATIDQMVKLFDEIWARDPFNGASNTMATWPGICRDNGWTSEDFDSELYEWQKHRIKRSA
jgi:hypothetical protein